MYFFSKQMINF